MNQLFILPQLEVLVQRNPGYGEPLIDELLAIMWDAPSKKELYHFMETGLVEPYYKQDGSGLILIETVDWSRGRELSIYGMVGSGIIRPKDAAPIIRDLKKLAAFKGCKMIGGVGVPTAWRRAAPALGFLPVSTHYVMEL